jgi:biotin transport system substrate-specific component
LFLGTSLLLRFAVEIQSRLAPRAWPWSRGPMRALLSLVLVAAFAGLIALGAQVAVPMTPVPMTLQTFAVLLAGAVLGAGRGAASVLLYLALAAAGLPILSDGASGLEAFSGPTAGYLFAFPVAAGLAGAFYDRTDGAAARIALMLGAHLLILATGAAWLATLIGARAALDDGFTPFLVGAGVKSVLAVLAADPLRKLASRLPA